MDQRLSSLIEQKQKQKQGSPPIDWDQRRDTYIAAVNDLYTQVEAILVDPIKQKMIVCQRRAKDITESSIGTYVIDDLVLLIGDEQVRFSPRGRNIVGAAGRVDVVGDRGEATLVLQPGPRWAFVKTRQPTLHIVPFDESVLAEILQIVMRD